MGSYVPPPPTNPTIGWEGQGVQKIPKAGLVLVPGTGVYARTESGRLLIDAQTAAPAESLCLSVPGALSAKTIATFASTRWAGEQAVTIVEASLIGAPTADPANHLALRLAGSVSGVQTLPLLAAYNSLNGATPTSRFAHDPGGGVDTGIINSNNFVRGWMQGIKASANQRVQSLSFFFPSLNAAHATGHSIAGCKKIFELMDAGGAVLASVTTTAALANGWSTFALPYSVPLEQGKVYYVGARIDTTQQQTSGSAVFCLGARFTAEASYVSPVAIADPSALPGDLAPSYLTMGSKAPTGTTWQDYFTARTLGQLVTSNGGITVNYPSAASGVTESFIGRVDGGVSQVRRFFRLNGSAGGFIIGGDMTLSLVSVGTGPSVAGSDLNVRVQVAQG